MRETHLDHETVDAVERRALRRATMKTIDGRSTETNPLDDKSIVEAFLSTPKSEPKTPLQRRMQSSGG